MMTPQDEPSRPTPAGRTTRSRQAFSLTVLVGVIAAFAVLFYQVIRPLFLPLFLGAVFALLAMPMQHALRRRGGLPAWLAAAGITTAVVLVVLIPTTLGFFLVKDQVRLAIDRLERTATDPGSRARLFEIVGGRLQVDPDELEESALRLLRDGEAILFQRAMQALGSATAFAVGAVLFLVAGFFFLKDGEAILRAWEDLTPLALEQDRQIRGRFAVVCRGVVLSILLAALAQSIGLGLGIALLDLAFGLGIGAWIFVIALVTAVVSIIPLMGPFVVWIPVAGALLLAGRYAPAIILVVYGVVVIGNVDNLVRMIVLRGTAQLHPLMGLISILGGVQLLGLVGVFVGPIVAAVFVSLLRILRQQLVEFDRTAAPG